MGAQPELAANEAEHGFGDQLAELKKTAGIAECAQLQREAEAVAIATPAPDVREVCIAQDVVAEQGRLVGWQGEQRLALPGGEDGASSHGPLPVKILVRDVLNVIRNKQR